MPTKKKLKLEDLSVKSFITDTESNKVKGGVLTEYKTICTGPCDTDDQITDCCDPVNTVNCTASCNGTCNGCPQPTATFDCFCETTPPDMYC